MSDFLVNKSMVNIESMVQGAEIELSRKSRSKRAIGLVMHFFHELFSTINMLLVSTVSMVKEIFTLSVVLSLTSLLVYFAGHTLLKVELDLDGILVFMAHSLGYAFVAAVVIEVLKFSFSTLADIFERG